MLNSQKSSICKFKTYLDFLAFDTNRSVLAGLVNYLQSILCFSFDVGDVLFQFRKANAGFVVPEGDLNGFVKGVERYIGNPKLRKTDGKKLQRSAIKELDICVITSSYINFCRSIVSFKCH